MDKLLLITVYYYGKNTIYYWYDIRMVLLYMRILKANNNSNYLQLSVSI